MHYSVSTIGASITGRTASVLAILSIFSVGFGYIAKDAFIGVRSDFLSTSLFQHPDHISLIEAEFGRLKWQKLRVLNSCTDWYCTELESNSPHSTIDRTGIKDMVQCNLIRDKL
jgi:hypothetical protein